MLIRSPVIWFVRFSLCILLVFSGSVNAKVNPVIETVTVGDFNIGDAGGVASLQAVQGDSNTTHHRVRELASLSGGESGTSVPSRGYLSDVVWSEKTFYPQSGAAFQAGQSEVTSSRIVYYGFNVGRWKKQLTAQTSVLTRAFMTQPALVFLTDSDKTIIAESMLKSDFYPQAIEEYEEYAADITGAYPTARFNDLIEAIGSEAERSLTEAQIESSTEKLSQRIVDNQRKELQETASGPIEGTINFSDTSQSFKVFSGMDIAGKRDETNKEILEFSSWSSLTYGLQPLSDFNNVSGSFFERVDRHFLTVPLLSPVNGFISTDTIKQTDFKLSKYPALNTVGRSVDVAMFRNNPNTYLDAPMAINLVTTGAVLAEVVGTSAALFRPKQIKNYMEKVKKITDAAEPYIEWAALVYTLVESAQSLICNVVDESEGICGDYFNKINRLKKLIPSGVISSMNAVLNGEEKDSKFDPDQFCGQIVTSGLLTGKVRKTNTLSNKNTKRTRLAVCGFNALVTAPIIAKIKKHFPTRYKKLGLDSTKSIEITADYLKRSKVVALKAQKVKKSQRLEALLALYYRTNLKFDLTQDLIAGLSLAMSASNDVVSFIDDAVKGKIKMAPLVKYIGDEAMDALVEKSGQLAADALYDVFISLTPAKYVQMAKTLGNKGGKLAWDWVTDPAVVKLRLQRQDEDTLAISHKIPNMIAVRYLKVPFKDTKVLHHTQSGLHYRADGDENIYPLAADSGSNNFLVLSGFEGSVENQSAFKDEDKDNVKKLINYSRVDLLWNVKKLANSSSDVKIPLTSRRSGDFNHLDIIIDKNILPWRNAIVGLDKDHWINRKIFSSEIDGYQAVDFSEIYKEQLGNGTNPYPLKHVTPGIFSDYTHLKYRSGAEEKTYSNQFNMYVLRGLWGWRDRLINESRRYQEKKSGQFTGVGEIQLNFDQANWGSIGKNGLWAIWRHIKNGKLYWSDPIKLGAIWGDETKVLAYPKGLDVSTAELIVYEDVLQGYLSNTLVSKAGVLNNIIQYFSTNPASTSVPIIRVPLKRLSGAAAVLTQADRDGDLTPDYLDDYPDDVRYQYDTDGDGMADSWEEQYELLPLKKWDGALDKDGDGYTNLEEFLGDTNPFDITSYPGTPVTTTGKLNDTGITQCSDATTNGLSCPVQDYPDQDAQYGRDFNNNDDSDGHAGFSFTKLDANGNELLANATEWSCVKDNVTGLIWEVKQGNNGVKGDQGLHDGDDTFNWYSTDTNNDGGFAGYANDDGYMCFGYDGSTRSYCNTEAFVDRVNEAGLCGASDWYLPTHDELRSIVNYGLSYQSATIDTKYFPNTIFDDYPRLYWSSTPHAHDSESAWRIMFLLPNRFYHSDKHYLGWVRLVRRVR